MSLPSTLIYNQYIFYLQYLHLNSDGNSMRINRQILFPIGNGIVKKFCFFSKTLLIDTYFQFIYYPNFFNFKFRWQLCKNIFFLNNTNEIKPSNLFPIYFLSANFFHISLEETIKINISCWGS